MGMKLLSHLMKLLRLMTLPSQQFYLCGTLFNVHDTPIKYALTLMATSRPGHCMVATLAIGSRHCSSYAAPIHYACALDPCSMSSLFPPVKEHRARTASSKLFVLRIISCQRQLHACIHLSPLTFSQILIKIIRVCFREYVVISN